MSIALFGKEEFWRRLPFMDWRLKFESYVE
jgi:hypothetical protein